MYHLTNIELENQIKSAKNLINERLNQIAKAKSDSLKMRWRESIEFLNCRISKCEEILSNREKIIV